MALYENVNGTGNTFRGGRGEGGFCSTAKVFLLEFLYWEDVTSFFKTCRI